MWRKMIHLRQYTPYSPNHRVQSLIRRDEPGRRGDNPPHQILIGAIAHRQTAVFLFCGIQYTIKEGQPAAHVWH